MRLPIRLFICLVALSLLLSSAMSILAQDAPTPFIPVISDDEGGDNSAAPTLDANVTPVPTQANPAETTVPDQEGTPAELTEQPAEATPTPLPEAQIPNEALECPIQVQEAVTATELICTDMLPGQACIGNGIIQAQPRTATEGFAFSQPGDRTEFSGLNSLALTTSNTENLVWAIVDAAAPFTTRDSGTSANATLIAFGDVSMSNTGDTYDPNFQTATVLAQQGLNVRRTPDERGVVVYQLEPSQEVVVTGRTADNQWIRIEIPSAFSGVGWVYAPYMGVDLETLEYVDADSPRPQLEAPEFGPMQAFSMQSTRYESCENTPDSGLLIQSPSGLADAVLVRINGVRIELNGAVFVQAQPDMGMEVDVLEGEALINAADTDVTATAGNAVRVGMTAEMTPDSAPSIFGYDETAVGLLPISLLPRPFGVMPASGEAAPTPLPSDADDTTQTTDDTAAASTPAAPSAAECLITAVDAPKNIRSGPGVSFPTVGALASGSSTVATGQANDSFNFTWYQVEEGWLRFDTVEASPGCTDLPVVEAPTQAAVTPTITATPSISLSSSELGAVCATGSVSTSGTSAGEELALELGGTWQATSGTRITVTTNGGMFRGEYGDYIRLTDSNDVILAQSGESTSLSYTFTADTTFTIGFSAANGDTVQATITCASA